MLFYLQTIAHDIGHNLGLEHDFLDFSNCEGRTPRVCDAGDACTFVGGIMDYCVVSICNSIKQCELKKITKVKIKIQN